MDVTPLVKQGAQIIQGYKDGEIRVNGQARSTPLLVFPDHIESWSAAALENLTEEHFDVLARQADAIDVILLGCGAHIKFLKPELKKSLRAKGLHIETMDTGAACRTYNVLLAEGRRVVAAFL